MPTAEGNASAYSAWAQSISYASIVALILASIFNVGYFVPIGLHFLGLMDFSNIVYSLALAFLFVLVGIGAAPTVAHIGIHQIVAFEQKRSAFVVIMFCHFCMIIVITVALLMSTKVMLDDRVLGLREEHFVLIGLFWILFRTSIMALVRKVHDQEITSTVTMMVCSAAAIAYTSGLSLSRATLLAQSPPRYHFEMKSSYAPIDANILRSSSLGFLVAKDKSVMFIPKEEVRSVSFDVTH